LDDFIKEKGLMINEWDRNYRPTVFDMVSLGLTDSWLNVIQIIDGGQAMILEDLAGGILRDVTGQALKVYNCEIKRSATKLKRGACPY